MQRDEEFKSIIREIRARTVGAPSNSDRLIALYARERPDFAELSTGELVSLARQRQAAVYSADSRLDMHEVVSTEVREAAAAVALMVHTDQLIVGTTSVELVTNQFGDEYQLCSAERYYDQPCVGFGSAALISADLVVTAAHCVPGLSLQHRLRELSSTRFVFGFTSVNGGTARTSLPLQNVYRGIDIVSYSLDDTTGSDWTVIRLDRPVGEAVPLRLCGSRRVPDRTRVSVIGHPCGLPTKYAPDAHVQDNTNEFYFTADLDVFGGNSGSPVLNDKMEVEGILVRGAPDFVWDGHCYRSLVIPIGQRNDHSYGEDCVRASAFAHVLSP